MAIQTPSVEYNEMLDKWKLPESLIGGTSRMRDGKQEWLPQEPNESDEAYEVRLHRTFLFNVYKKTLDSLVGVAFSSAVTVEGLPSELEYLEYNINGEGQSITELGAQLFHDSLHFGKCHVFPDFPAADTEGMSYAEFKELGLRPYIARISPKSVIGWNHSYNNGYADLNHVRILEVYFEETNEFEQVLVHSIKYITKSTIQVWESRGGAFNTVYTGVVQTSPEAGWVKVREYPNTIGSVNLLCAYANKQAPFVAYPVLEDLAWLNLCHYQSSSDQRNILHVARVPFLLAKGFTEEDLSNVTLAANRMVLTENAEADIKFVEHTGQAIASGQQDMDKLEQQMSKVGAEILFSKSVARQTLGSRKIDQAESLSVTQVALRSIEQMLEQALIVCGKWLDINEFEPSVTIGADLDLPEDPNPVQGLATLQELLNMDDATLLEELKRRKLVSAHVKPENLNIQQEEPQTEPETLTEDREDQLNVEEPRRGS